VGGLCTCTTNTTSTTSGGACVLDALRAAQCADPLSAATQTTTCVHWTAEPCCMHCTPLPYSSLHRSPCSSVLHQAPVAAPAEGLPLGVSLQQRRAPDRSQLSCLPDLMVSLGCISCRRRGGA
jgi:hypothetical protein